jgi:dTDP-glucose 4,6-dehydratase
MAADRILPTFVRRALTGESLDVLGEGSRGQDYVDARDIAAAVEASIDGRATGLLNIGSGRCITNIELAKLCVELLDSSSEVRLSRGQDPEEGVRWEVSTARAQESIGYRPRHPLEDSIAALAAAMGDEQRDG